eukprot:4301803-Alexandrium_andersonii.AAC.1
MHRSKHPNPLRMATTSIEISRHVETKHPKRQHQTTVGSSQILNPPLVASSSPTITRNLPALTHLDW